MTASKTGRPTAEALQGRTLHVAGMSRGGTTYLYHTLQRHPHLFLPERKEICYFGHGHHHGLDWWLDFYRRIREDQIAVDICGLYFMDDRAIDRILDFNPHAKVILSLREPLEWIYSVYEHYSTIFDTPPIDAFVEGCVWPRDGQQIALSFSGGRIEHTVEAMKARLGENLLLVDFELIGRDPLRMLRAIESFCEIRPWYTEDNFSKARINSRGQSPARLLGRAGRLPGVPWLTRALPRPLVMGIRSWLEAERKGATRPAAPEYTDGERKRVKEALASDQAYVKGLFEAGAILVDGRPVEDGA